MFKISLKSNLNPTFLLNLITSFKDYKFKKSFKPFKYTLKILLILILITNFLLILDPLFLAIETKAVIQKNQQEIESLEKLENPQEIPQNFEENLQENPQNSEENTQKPKNSDLNETKANDPVLEKPVSPVLERVQKISDTQFLAIFGYNNQNEASVSIPVGDNNYFHPTPANRNQTQEFKPGRQRATFTVEMGCKQTLVWTLKSPDGSKKTSTATSPECPEKPEEEDGDQDDEQIDLDTTLPNSNLHFFDKVTSLENNQIKLPQTACYTPSTIKIDRIQ